MRRLNQAVGGAAALVLLAGCGGGFADESADTIVKAAAEDMKKLKSVRMEGDIATQGQEISLDMQVATDGACQGSLSMMGGTAEIISTGDETWFKPDDAFWDATAGAQADQVKSMVGDKWVVMPPGQSDVASLCDLDQLLDQVGSKDGIEDAKKGETEDVDGEEAVVVEGKTEEDDPLKAWIATEGEHHILKMEVTQGDEPGTITFSEFDEDFEVQPPADDQVVDFSQMGG